MSEWKQYRRVGLAEMRPYVAGEDLTGISVSAPDLEYLSGCYITGERPKGMIARNPDKHEDKWFVSRSYFEKNFEEARVPDESDGPVGFMGPDAWEAYRSWLEKYHLDESRWIDGVLVEVYTAWTPEGQRMKFYVYHGFADPADSMFFGSMPVDADERSWVKWQTRAARTPIPIEARMNDIKEEVAFLRRDVWEIRDMIQEISKRSGPE